jgi:hypothetical protein
MSSRNLQLQAFWSSNHWARQLQTGRKVRMTTTSHFKTSKTIHNLGNIYLSYKFSGVLSLWFNFQTYKEKALLNLSLRQSWIHFNTSSRYAAKTACNMYVSCPFLCATSTKIGIDKKIILIPNAKFPRSSFVAERQKDGHEDFYLKFTRTLTYLEKEELKSHKRVASYERSLNNLSSK